MVHKPLLSLLAGISVGALYGRVERILPKLNSKIIILHKKNQ
jgi:hypothetical protein